MTFTANPFDHVGTLETTGVGVGSGAGVLPVIGSVTGATVSGGVVTVTTASTANIWAGQVVTIYGITGFSAYNPNGSYVVQDVPDGATFTIAPANAPTGSYSSGGSIRLGADPGYLTAASVSPCFTDATLPADAANRVQPTQPIFPTASWH